MNGAGNDFVFIDRTKAKTSVTPSLARKMLDRHFGVGGDQMLILEKSKNGTPYRLRFYNADGSTAEMCGNGSRAAAYYLYQKGQRKNFAFETKAGRIGVEFNKGRVSINMGPPREKITRRSVRVAGKTFQGTLVSMGNPHCVIYVKDVKSFPVAHYGPLLEHHPYFPKRTNVEFVQVLSRGRVRSRIWERGAGETLACGTGACAIAAAGAYNGKTARDLRIELPGGELRANWASDGNIHLSGPAEINYEGEFYV